MERQTYSTGTPWEKAVGYSRAVRVGQHIFVSGTTASNADGSTVAAGNAYEQTVFILRKIETALAEVGANLSDVVRTRMLVTDIERWEEFGRAYGEFFRGINPTATMVEVRRLVNPDHLVEIEVSSSVPCQLYQQLIQGTSRPSVGSRSSGTERRHRYFVSRLGVSLGSLT